ncbi:unnamed protein product [Urochloa humidicola]
MVTAIRALMSRGLTGAGLITAYHERRLAPLMMRRLPMFEMTAEADLSGTRLSEDTLAPTELGQRLKEVLKASAVPDQFPLQGQPPMMPSPGASSFENLGHYRSRPRLREAM